MKKVMAGVVGGIVVCGLALSVSMSCGCKVTPDQGKVIAKNAGLYSSVIWIAIDNPNTNQILEVKDILSIVKTNTTKIEKGQTYMEVVYPEVVKIIDVKVPAQDRPLCKVASMTLLNGIDILFAMHPDWEKDQVVAIEIVNSYIDGANEGLSMNESSRVMKQARASANSRAKLFVQEEEKALLEKKNGEEVKARRWFNSK